MAALYGRTALDTLHERVGEEDHLRNHHSPDDDETFNGTWARLFFLGGQRDGGDRGIYDSQGPRFNYELYGFQAGLDVYRKEDEDHVRNHAGLYAVIGRVEAKVRNYTGQTAGQNVVDAWSLGGYWTRFDEAGAYLDGVVQFSWFDATAQSTRLPALKGNARGLALSLEGGKPYSLKNDWWIEPQGQLIYQHFYSDRAADAGGIVHFDGTDSLVGRIGGRLLHNWMHENDKGEPRLRTAWGRLNLWHEFLDQPATTFDTDGGPLTFTADTGTTWLELNGGLTRQMSETGAFYINATYSWDIDGRGHSYTGKIGYRFNW